MDMEHLNHVMFLCFSLLISAVGNFHIVFDSLPLVVIKSSSHCNSVSRLKLQN